MCKHFQETGECPLNELCQFAHGSKELRHTNSVSTSYAIYNRNYSFDRLIQQLPNNFVNNHPIGAVHSNYKTKPCKNMQREGQCKFGAQCSFYHNEEERRKLIDPLPKLPEGVTLPPMPEKLRNNNKLKIAKQ